MIPNHFVTAVLPRLLVGTVLVWNVQCALAFLITPARFATGFELSGAVGDAVVRGMGILFLMWNVPYAFALLNPYHFRISLIQAVLMQSIGLVGETLILLQLPAGHPLIHAAVLRFILFDAAGLVLLLVTLVVTTRIRSGTVAGSPSGKS